MKTILILALLLIPVKAFAFCDDWKTANTVAEASFQVLAAIDWGQTLNFTQHTDREESNPWLGKHPSRDRVNTLIPLGMIAHAGISCLLPNPPRFIWQTFTVLIEASAVSTNFQLGIGVSF